MVTKIPPNSEIAKPSCKHCYGTGTSGNFINGVDRTMPDNTVKKAPRVPIICTCVQRARERKVPWLQRHGKDQQPWLIEE